MTGWNLVAILMGLIAIAMNIVVRVHDFRRRRRIERANEAYDKVDLA